jgi:hypothetical protein
MPFLFNPLSFFYISLHSVGLHHHVRADTYNHARAMLPFATLSRTPRYSPQSGWCCLNQREMANKPATTQNVTGKRSATSRYSNKLTCLMSCLTSSIPHTAPHHDAQKEGYLKPGTVISLQTCQVMVQSILTDGKPVCEARVATLTNHAPDGKYQEYLIKLSQKDEPLLVLKRSFTPPTADEAKERAALDAVHTEIAIHDELSRLGSGSSFLREGSGIMRYYDCGVFLRGNTRYSC